jgi:hypothetical protein
MTGGGSSIILSFSPPRLTKQQIIILNSNFVILSNHVNYFNIYRTLEVSDCPMNSY